MTLCVSAEARAGRKLCHKPRTCVCDDVQLDHVPFEVERGGGGEASQRGPARVPDTVLHEDEEGEVAGDLLQLVALHVQVLEGLLQSGEGFLRQSEIVIRELDPVVSSI